MVKRMILVLLFVVGIPVLSGQIRASNIEDGERQALLILSHTDVDYDQVLGGREIINCFVWEEIVTVLEVESSDAK
jgi:hypothetical protein